MAAMLPRVLSRFGALSRKAAEQAVFDGRVAVDGRVVRDVLRRVDPDRQRITLDGRELSTAPRVWLALHKPRQVIATTSDPEGRATVMDLLGRWSGVAGLAPVGRLDRDSQGLILLTNDHVAAARLLDPAFHVRKVYRIKVAGHPSDASLARLIGGEWTEFGPADGVSRIRANPASEWIEVALSEGKNRQLRRMCEAIGHPVEALVRTSFGAVALGELRPGEIRALGPDEIDALTRRA